MNNRPIIIPDIHGRTFWKDAIPFIEAGNPVIFLGDYLDPYDHEYITPGDALNNFKEILEVTKGRDNVHLLIGNHDCTYIWPMAHICNCRTDYTNYDEICRLFADNLDRFHIYFIYDNILFTHAGVHSKWLSYLTCHRPDKPIDEIMAEYDELLHAGDRGAIQELACISRIRGGDDIVGSCVWADIHEFDDNNVDIPYRQIVGHTQQIAPKWDHRLRRSFFQVLGPLKFGNVTCVDCHRCFLIENGEPYPLDPDTDIIG
jgi:hypothetical protein